MLTVLVGALSILAGFLIGTTPVLRDFVHVYAWATIPITGLLFGAAIGALQFFGCFQFSLLGNKLRAAFLAVCAVLAFIAADIGTYATISVPVRGMAQLPDGKYKLRSLISLREYAQFYFSERQRHSNKFGNFQVSSTENKIGYALEVIEVAVCAPLILLNSWAKFRICGPCGTYLRRRRGWKIQHASRDEVNRVLGKIHAAIQRPGLQALSDVLNAEKTSFSFRPSRYLISAEERMCPLCKAISVHGAVRVNEGKNSVELPEASFEKFEVLETTAGKPG